MRIRLLLLLTAVLGLTSSVGIVSAASPGNDAGALGILGKNGKIAGECPLRHTDMQAELSGAFSRVTVTQSFENPHAQAIEAVYTLPLPHDAAVDDMTITIGKRVIHGVIRKREEAQKIYQQALKHGQTAALLDQERPNIFSQRVGNIPPGSAIDVTITYVAPLKYEDGSYEFAFPMVVGPRYIPGDMVIGKSAGGTVPNTDPVPDASKITPPVAPHRAGHDISIAVTVNAGVAIQNLRSSSHEIDVKRPTANEAEIRLRDEATIPNKDFILRYDVAGAQVAEGMLTHTRSSGDGYFSLIVQPPGRFHESDVTPKEIVFVLDSSGSMNGFPEERAKLFIDKALDGLYADDTFNVIKFSGETAILFKEPVYPTAKNVAQAREFLNSQWGGGGTEMMKAIRAALDPSDAQDHLRIVVFLTDGYVGNDFEILSEIRKHSNARVFAFGVGSSVNRYLISGMGQQGNGDSEVITADMKKDEIEAAAQRLYEHLRSPLLTDISLDFGSLPVADIYPARILDLFAARPVVVTGRYLHGGKGTVRITAKRAGSAYTQDLPVVFPERSSDNDVLPSLWARAKIEHLMSQDLSGVQQQAMKPELQRVITQLGLNYHLMTQFTSFVAVEDRVSTEGGKPITIQVPLELPEGVQYETGWSGEKDLMAAQLQTLNTSGRVVGGLVARNDSPALSMPKMAPPPPSQSGSGRGVGAGSAGGGGMYRVGAGVVASQAPDRADAKSPAYKSKDEALLASKSHPRILEAYSCWIALADKSKADSTCKLSDGKMKLEVVLSGTDLTALTTAGFVPDGTIVNGRIHGTIAIEKLPALAELKEVRFIAPRP